MGTQHDLLEFGLSTSGGPFAADDLTATAVAAGRNLDWVLWFEQFGSRPPLAGLRAVGRLAALPLITWEPWRWRARPVDIMAQIAAGARDTHIRQWARRLRDSSAPVHLRFGHEFNGDWYPWSPAGGTPAEVFVDVWHRLHRIFADEGATAVQWVWSPNALLPNGEPLEQWYPGDDSVDLVGVDGYNWGNSQHWSHWVQPAELFTGVLDEVAQIAGGKPVIVTEVACAESGGEKAEWISAFVDYLATRAEVAGFIWFDHDKETDWRITSSPQATAAMAAALHDRSAARHDCGAPA